MLLRNKQKFKIVEIDNERFREGRKGNKDLWFECIQIPPVLSFSFCLHFCKAYLETGMILLQIKECDVSADNLVLCSEKQKCCLLSRDL